MTYSAGNGSGGFAPPVAKTVGSVPFFMISGDINGDGIADLMLLDISVYKAHVFSGSMSGLGNEKIYTTGNSPVALSVGDFDGDQRPDLVVANQSSNDVTILTNKSQ